MVWRLRQLGPIWLTAQFEPNIQRLKRHARCTCVHAENLKGDIEEKGLQHAHPPWVVLFHFSSLSLSLSPETTGSLEQRNYQSSSDLLSLFLFADT